ncbi:unnamed protein product [Didymodactylos carnosus]|uniref:Uncharacterized protein n=1 Tax=Didymodactylos carnosus TaxID=1234261 RepID=A0A814V7Y6_9BILA|nr:unnamed protein product [Didymodactylos carnosus]CAF3948663.1 unnamed protein product [Didymodactylos carnosus]
MGNIHSSVKINDFYSACENGDVILVNEILNFIPYEQIDKKNKTTGDTGLHAAAANGHANIVKLLLDFGADAIIANKEMKTPYEVASNEDIKKLFHRRLHSSNRFIEADIKQAAEIKFFNKSSNDDDIPLNNYANGHRTVTDTIESQLLTALYQSNYPTRKLVQIIMEKRFAEQFINLVETKEKKIEKLLQLYTLNSCLPELLHDDPTTLTALVYLHLKELKLGAFQGVTFRGVTMNDEDLNIYHWAQENNGIIEIKVLSSTSLSEEVARHFVTPSDRRHKVLMQLIFPIHCYTAINLNCIADKLPTISRYPEELEVLVLPFTLFRVECVQRDRDNYWRMILKNVSLNGSVRQTMQTNPYKQSTSTVVIALKLTLDKIFCQIPIIFIIAVILLTIPGTKFYYGRTYINQCTIDHTQPLYMTVTASMEICAIVPTVLARTS